MENKINGTSNCLRAHRKITKYQQKEIAFLLGLDQATQVSLWESGVALPNTINLIKLYLLYGAPLEELYPDLIRQLRKELKEKQDMLFTQLRDKRMRDDGT